MKINKTLIMNMLPTLNGRQYTLSVLESIRNQINSRDVVENIGVLGTGTLGVDIVSLHSAGFNYSNAIIENDCLYCDIELLKTTAGDTIKDALNATCVDNIAFRPAGIGTIESQGDEQMKSLLDIPPKIMNVNEDYKLISITAIPKSDDALVYKIDENETEIL